MSAPLATPRDDAPLTVELALRLPSLRRGAPNVVAGRGGLGRTIRWVHSSEVQNISELLRGGELLLMTGMAIGKRPEAQRRFIHELALRGVAALVIELGQVYRELPPEMVRQAEADGLPLVVLRREVPFVEVTEEIHTAILSRALLLLRQVEALHAQLAELMIDGGGIPELLALLAAFIANPVLLVHDTGGVLYHATHRASADEALAARSLGVVDPAHRIAVPVIGAHGHRWGQLVALAVDSPLDDLARSALERTVRLAALALSRAGEEAALRARERGNFLGDLLGGRVSGRDAALRAAALGLDTTTQRLLPIAIVLSAPRSSSDPAATPWALVGSEIREALRAAGLRGIVGLRASENDMLIVLAISGGVKRASALEGAVGAIRRATVRAIGNADAIVIAVGELVRGWDDAPHALRQAQETAVLAAGAPARAWHDATSPDLTRLLWSLRDDAHVREFVDQRLRPLLEHDRSRGARLLPTLEALCEHHWRKAEAARALRVNRQSLYPRIARIERALGADLEDPETRLSLELALRLHRHLKRSSPAP